MSANEYRLNIEYTSRTPTLLMGKDTDPLYVLVTKIYPAILENSTHKDVQMYCRGITHLLLGNNFFGVKENQIEEEGKRLSSSQRQILSMYVQGFLETMALLQYNKRLEIARAYYDFNPTIQKLQERHIKDCGNDLSQKIAEIETDYVRRLGAHLCMNLMGPFDN